MQAAGQSAGGVQAPVDAVHHHGLDAGDEGTAGCLAVQRAFVGPEQVGYWAIVLIGQCQQLGHGGKGVGHVLLGATVAADEVLVGIDHKAAANRIHFAAAQQLARSIPGAKAHAVGVQGQLFAAVEEQIARGVKSNFVLRQQRQPPCAANVGHACADALGVNGIGNFATQAHQNGQIGAVALAGVGQRTE